MHNQPIFFMSQLSLLLTKEDVLLSANNPQSPRFSYVWIPFWNIHWGVLSFFYLN